MENDYTDNSEIFCTSSQQVKLLIKVIKPNIGNSEITNIINFIVRYGKIPSFPGQ